MGWNHLCEDSERLERLHETLQGSFAVKIVLGMKVRVHVFVSGLVQGVFFRSETRRIARRCSVTGWVRNLRDGRVEAVFEGERENVEKMVEFCKKGPSSARIVSTEISLETYKDEFSDFSIVW